MESTKAAISAELAKMANAVDLRTFRALNRTCVCVVHVSCPHVCVTCLSSRITVRVRMCNLTNTQICCVCAMHSLDLFKQGVVEGLELGLVRMLHLSSHRHIWLHLSCMS